LSPFLFFSGVGHGSNSFQLSWGSYIAHWDIAFGAPGLPIAQNLSLDPIVLDGDVCHPSSGFPGLMLKPVFVRTAPAAEREERLQEGKQNALHGRMHAHVHYPRSIPAGYAAVNP